MSEQDNTESHILQRIRREDQAIVEDVIAALDVLLPNRQSERKLRPNQAIALLDQTIGKIRSKFLDNNGNLRMHSPFQVLLDETYSECQAQLADISQPLARNFRNLLDLLVEKNAEYERSRLSFPRVNEERKRRHFSPKYRQT